MTNESNKHRTATVYEWDLELAENPWIDEAGDVIADVIAHNHEFRLADIRGYPAPTRDDEHYRLVLIRDVFDAYNGDLLSRSWCYLNEDGNLSDTFDNGKRVPKRFRDEFNRHRSWASLLVEPELEGSAK